MTTKKLLFPALAAALAGTAFGQADECANATDLGSGNTSIAFDTNMCSDTGTLATTSAEQQCFSLSEDVWFKWTASVDGFATFDTCNNATFDTEIGIWEGADCSTFVGLGCNDDNGGAGCLNFTSLISVPVVAGETYYAQLGYWAGGGGVWGSGTLTVSEVTGPDCTVADSLEPNVDCSTATPVMATSYTDLNVEELDNDYYSIDVPAGDVIAVDLTFSDDLGDMDLYLWDPLVACDTNVAGQGTGTGALAVGFSASDNESIMYANTTGATQSLIIEVDMFDAGGCNGYDMDIALTPDPCGTADMFEPNTDCNNTAAIGDGTFPNLSVSDTDNDYYLVGLDNGGTITADIFFSNATADIDLYLWDPLVACDTNVAGPGTGTGALAVGFSATDDESISYTNTTGAAQTLVIEIDMFTTGGCNSYELSIAGTSGNTGLGSPYCMANANSTGAAAAIAAAGSALVANNDVTLTTTGMPNNSFGFFLTGTMAAFVPNPGGSAGNLCVGGILGRYVDTGQIQNSGNAGEISLAIDLPTTPGAMAPNPILPGDTRYFTSWFRDSDMGTATSNFSNGVSIDFN